MSEDVEEIKMTPEMKEALYGLLPWEDGEYEDVILPVFDGRRGPKPVFLQRPFTAKELRECRKSASKMKPSEDEEDFLGYTEDFIRDITRATIGGWRDLVSHPRGREFVYSPDENGSPTVACFKKLPFALVFALYSNAAKMAQISDVERQGFELPQDSEPGKSLPSA